MIKTIKFGGTSLSCGKNIALSATMIKKENANHIVASAPGKRFHNDEKITDLLLACANSGDKKERKNAFVAVKNRFSEIKSALDSDVDLTEDFLQTENEIFAETESEGRYSFIVSRGEYFCAKLIANYVGFEFIGGDRILNFDGDGALDVRKSVEQAKCALTRVKGCVIAGFYGSNDSGQMHILPRGGSDVSGAIVAAAVNSEYFNCTDVDGFCRCNPAIVENAASLANLSYAEAMRAANNGATVVHPLAVEIAKEYNTEIIVKNTFNPNFSGTIIGKNRAEPKKYGAIAVTNVSDCVCVIFGDNACCRKCVKEELLSVLSTNGIAARERHSDNGVFSIATNDVKKAVNVLYAFLF